jgi:hypothetical protein
MQEVFPWAIHGSNKMQNDQRHKVEEHDPNLVDRDAAVVYRVKSLDRYLEPTAVHPVQPVMRKNKRAKPHEQDRVVDQRTPDQKM